MDTAPIYKKRNHAFDFLCGICIIRMLLLHVTGMCGLKENEVWMEIMHWSFYFMSFFFFKAGYFNKTVDGNSRDFVTKKAKQLLVPYFVWGWIGCAVYFYFAAFILPADNTMVKSMHWSHLWESSGFWGNGPCWFLFSFFTAYIAMHFIEKCPSLAFPISHKRSLRLKLHWIALVFPLVSYWLYTKGNPLPLSLNNVFWGIFLFFLGRVWRVAIERLRPRRMIILSCTMLAVFCLLNFFDDGEYVMSENIWRGNVYVTLPKIILSICGLSGLLLSVHIPRIPIINYIGEHSMVYFVSHYPLLMFYKMLRSSYVRTTNGHWDDWIILVILIFVFCSWLVPYVESTPWLSGRFKSKKKTQTITTP